MKKKTAPGMAALALAMMLPEGAARGGLGLAWGLLLSLALMALAAWLLWRAGVLAGKKPSAQASATGSGAQDPRRKGMR